MKVFAFKRKMGDWEGMGGMGGGERMIVVVVESSSFVKPLVIV